MAEKLADYVVGLGLKGQNVALLEINKAKKAGKELSKQRPKLNFGNVRAEINARKQLETIRRQSQATRGQTELLKKREQQQAKVVERAQGVGRTGVSGLSTAMTSGASGLASSLPGIGALFGAASSAVELAGQEYIAGVTASKNINLVTQNYSRAFQGAFADGVGKAVKSTSGVFAGRTGAAFVTSLADQGVTEKSLQGAIPALNQLANAQGVGSIDELMGRLQSGTLKEGAGLSKADIVLLQSQSQLLNNRFTSDVGAQMLTQTLGRLSPGMQKAATQTAGITSMAGAENLIKDREESFRSGGVAADKDGKLLDNIFKARSDDRNLRWTLLPLSMGLNKIPGKLIDKGKKIKDKIGQGDWKGAAEEFTGSAELLRLKQEKDAADAKAASPGGGELMEGSTSGGGAPLSTQSESVNNDIMRSGRAIADTLRDINNQLNVTRAQMRRG